MGSSGYITRLTAMLATAGIFGAMIFQPNAGKQYVEKAAGLAQQVERNPMSTRACAIGEPALSGPFAPLQDVLSVSPLGGLTAPEEVRPAPYIRINTRAGETAFDRRTTSALSPARAEITAIERHIDRDAYGRATSQTWTVHFKTCERVSVYYSRLDQIDESILERAGGLRQFTELGGPDHIALMTSIKLKKGDVIGLADGFDVGLHDRGAPAASMARPERYRHNHFSEAAVLDVSADLIQSITPDVARAQCAIDYLPEKQRADWTDKLGDAWGVRRAKGDSSCRTALLDKPGAAQGAWFTDPANNGVTTKVSAIALGPDAVDPDRLIFALHGRLASLTPDLVALSPFMDHERAKAAKDFLSVKKGGDRINPGFDQISDSEMYCFEGLRANFVGPLINGVILMQRQGSSDEEAPLKIEARGDVQSCIDLEEPWAFSGNETTFYR